MVDLHDLLKDSSDVSKDGIHFTSKGYQKMADAMTKKIKELEKN